MLPVMNAHASNIAPKKAWFLRLIPPRPTFDKDLNEHEQKLMTEHFLYWKGLFGQGICVFGGPVFDPRGVFGVVVVENANEDELREIADGDPSVKAGLNRWEIAEMRITFLPKP
ncbi:MAG: YciI family protein [Terracidiphilus sp.]|jgi:uncharacterized protein YciI